MTRGIAARLLDAIEAIDAIEYHTAGMTWTDFEAQDGIRRIVERYIEIIGEAIARAEDLDDSLATKIPDIRQIVGARNEIAHGYCDIDLEILWEIVIAKAPELREILRPLLDEYS
jgi:uncharacterized protein with HEPN domain